MSYSYSKQRRRAVPTRWVSASSGADSQTTASRDPTADDRLNPADEHVDRRLMTDGGEDQSDDERDEESEAEGGDEEMQPPEQEGEAGVEEAEEAEEEESEEAEAEEAEQEEPEEPEEPEAEGEKESEGPEAEAVEEEKAEEPDTEATEEEKEEEEEEEEEEVVDVPQSDIESEGVESDESTTVLFLDIYGLDLDLLGLEIQLHQVVLDVFATEGDGNLLGNLLSSVAGLTDPGGLSDLMPDGGLSGLLPEDGILPEGGILPDDGIKNALRFGGTEGEQGEEGDGDESPGFISSTASKLRDSIPSLPIKQLLIEVIAGVIKQLLESPKEDASGEES